MPQINGAILADTDGRWFGGDAEGWTPSEADILSAERAVLERIRTDAPALFDRLDEYLCQYIGFAVGGRLRIYCNFFHHEQEEARGDWRTEPVFVLDGGDDYFHTVYDVDSGQCVEFYVNGEG